MRYTLGWYLQCSEMTIYLEPGMYLLELLALLFICGTSSSLHICRLGKNANTYFTGLFQENKRCINAVHHHITFFAVSCILLYSD